MRGSEGSGDGIYNNGCMLCVYYMIVTGISAPRLL